MDPPVILSVRQFIVDPDEPHRGRIVRILTDVIGTEHGLAVLGHQAEEQLAQYTALWGASAEGDCP